MIDESKKRLVAIVIAIFGFVVIIIIMAVVLTIKQNGNQIAIGNYDKYVKSLPQDRRKAINEALYNIIKSSPTTKNISVSDALIRDGSYTEYLNKSEGVYSSLFIVDMASIKQSYKVIFSWSKNANAVLTGDILKFDCLPKDQLKYGDFKCNEILNIPIIIDDPILQYLPQSTFNYKITVNPAIKGKIGLYIRIYLYSSDTRGGNADQAVEKYKQNAVDWIKSKGLDINDYSIEYIVD